MKYLLLIIFLLASPAAYAQEVHQDLQGTWRAEVLEIISEEEITIPGTETKTILQTLSAKILDGESKDKIVTVENDFIQLEKGDKFFLNYIVDINGTELYSVSEPDRRASLYILIVLFVAVAIFFGGLQGLRSLFALLASFFVIIYLMLPSILSGLPPLLAGVGFSILILGVAMYLTHGFKRKTHAAFLGTILTIVLVGLIALWAVGSGQLSGFSSDEALYLNLQTRGSLDLAQLLIAAIIIGALGILDDIAITQASIVQTLKNNVPDITRRKAYQEAIKVGKEHVGALINTLALAYAGASLPLLLLFYGADQNVSLIINREIFATEIIRTIAGSIGLILAVPISTILAALIIIPKKK